MVVGSVAAITFGLAGLGAGAFAQDAAIVIDMEAELADKEAKKAAEEKAEAEAKQKAESEEPVLFAPASEYAEEVPDEEKLSRSKAALERMRAALAQVLKYLGEAREERDVVKLNCVNEKLTAIKGLLKISEQAQTSLLEFIARRNVEAAVHKFDMIMIAKRKIDQLLGESEGCIGEMAVYVGDTQVEVEITGVGDDDPTQDITDFPPVLRPSAASPFQ